jgi:hypothetical protein
MSCRAGRLVGGLLLGCLADRREPAAPLLGLVEFFHLLPRSAAAVFEIVEGAAPCLMQM